LKAKPECTIARIAKFLDIKCDSEKIKATMAGSNFKVMRAANKNIYPAVQRKLVDGKAVGHFRVGKSGSWRDKFTVFQSLRYDKLLEEKLGDLPRGLRIDFGKGVVWISHGKGKSVAA